MPWGSEIEIEIKRRIDVAAWAYAYEIENNPIVDDARFDAVCRHIDPSTRTGRKAEDEFFANEFDPSTGVWIYKHPDLNGIRRILKIKRSFINGASSSI